MFGVIGELEKGWRGGWRGEERRVCLGGKAWGVGKQKQLAATVPGSHSSMPHVPLMSCWFAPLLLFHVTPCPGDLPTPTPPPPRFWAALVLLDLTQEVPVEVVAAKYGLAKGQLQALQERAGEVSECLLVRG